MGLYNWRVLNISIMVVSFLFAVNFAVSAEESNWYVKESAYLGMILPYNALGGDFDGESILFDQNETFLVPKVENNNGWGIVWGGRGETIATELSYINVKHNISWLGAKGEAEFNQVSLDIKGYFLEDLVKFHCEPFWQTGCILWTSLKVKDASAAVITRRIYPGDEIAVGDAYFSGYFPSPTFFPGYNFGGGLDFYLMPEVILSGNVIYRFIWYQSAKGAAGKVKDIEDTISGRGLNYSVSLKYVF